MSPARRRGLLMLCCALVCGGLAASQVRERERRAEAAVGPLVSVVVAERDLPAERRLRAHDLGVRRMPARFAPPDALGGRGLVVGARLAAPMAAGSYLTAGLLEGSASDERSGLRPGQRAVEVAVGGGSALAGARPGSRVDVVVSTQSGDAGGRALVALEDVELLDLRTGGTDGYAPEGGGGDGGGAPSALATLRVTVRQAVYLAAAANFAQEIRLLVRPPGDHAPVGPAAVGPAGLLRRQTRRGMVR